MAQEYRLVNLDCKMIVRGPHCDVSPEYDTNNCLRSLEAMLVWDGDATKYATNETAAQAAKQRQNQSPFLRVPPQDDMSKILTRIVQFAARPHDPSDDKPKLKILAKLALTCEYLFEICKPMIKDVFTARAPEWIGARIVTILPQTPEDGHCKGVTAKEMFRYEEFISSMDYSEVIQQFQVCAMLTASQQRLYERLFPDPFKYAGILQDNFVLRNLSRKEFVLGLQLEKTMRERSHSERTTAFEQRHDAFWSFAQVIAVMTRWDDHVDGPLWAGDRFDIIPISKMSFEGWTDQSGLVIMELEDAEELDWLGRPAKPLRRRQ